MADVAELVREAKKWLEDSGRFPIVEFRPESIVSSLVAALEESREREGFLRRQVEQLRFGLHTITILADPYDEALCTEICRVARRALEPKEDRDG